MNTTVGDSGFASSQRQKIFTWLVLAVGSIFIVRLGYLQIFQGSVYRAKAETQAIKQIKVEPFRGNFIDRHGRMIVQNTSGFSITITPYEFTKESAARLSSIIGIPDSVIWREVRTVAVRNKFQPAKMSFGRDVDFDVLSQIEERHDELAGVDLTIEPKRRYMFDGNAAHLFGYTREVSPEQLKRLGDAYEPGDMTGKAGIELTYEPFVRGQKGYEFIAVNKSGQRVESFNNGKSDLQAREGFDLYLGLDADLQELAEKLLSNWKGSAVALDPNNGEILAFVSKPDFDPRQLTGREGRAYFNDLVRDPRKLFFNRASQSMYPPGSTWKPLMALAGLAEGVITETSTLHCAGGFAYGNAFCKCHGGVHGNIRVKDAVAVSCNAFFNQIALRLGVERHHYYASLFGFGQKTRADISEEFAGIIPNTEWMNKRYGKRGWTKYATVNWGIGQGEVSVTPLQMAAYMCAIANEGTLYQPHAVRAIYNKALRRKEVLSFDERKIPIDKHYFQIVKEGMRQVVTNGTARSVDIPGFEVCGKTGTAQTGGKDQSWFVCFAPKDNPRIAIVVTAEEGSWGATTAGPIARKMLEWFFLKQWPADVKRDPQYELYQQPAAKPDTTKAVASR